MSIYLVFKNNQCDNSCNYHTHAGVHGLRHRHVYLRAPNRRCHLTYTEQR